MLPSVTTAGKDYKPLAALKLTAATYICYESVFPQVARTMVKRGSDVLVNISNDAWFGKGNGAEQHYLMGSMRAIETRRYILRAGNDGITAVIDPYGRELERLERGIRGTLVGDYAFANVLTPYVRYGDMLILLTLLYSIFVGAFLYIRQT